MARSRCTSCAARSWWSRCWRRPACWRRRCCAGSISRCERLRGSRLLASSGPPRPGRRARALPAAPDAAPGVGVLRRGRPAGRRGVADPVPLAGRRPGRPPRQTRRTRVHRPGVRAQTGHGGRPQRLDARLRPRDARMRAVRDVLPRTLRDFVRVLRRLLRRAGLQGAPAGGRVRPGGPAAGPVWGMLSDAGIPVVVHAGHAPMAASFTGPEPFTALLARHPRLTAIVAHMGSPDYSTFLDLATRYERVALDTTMVFTPFFDQLVPFPLEERPRLRDLGQAGKILLGTDFPNIPYEYADQLQGLVRLDLGDAWLRAVCWHNLWSTLGLTGSHAL
ncbi:amidohydrolase family protein [Phytohabitans rumicis]|nr:amidohydrolase family protein [Phytohabitans rumicis]